MGKHTPGPWYVVSAVEVDPSIIGGTPSRRTVHTVFKEKGISGLVADFANLADANLCSAAPDLLAELQSVLDWSLVEKAQLRPQEIASIRAAIAKALGR